MVANASILVYNDTIWNNAPWNVSGTNVFLNNPGDNVGIGTSAPAYNLEIGNSATAMNVSGFMYVNSSNIRIGKSPNYVYSSYLVTINGSFTNQGGLYVDNSNYSGGGYAIRAQGSYLGYGIYAAAGNTGVNGEGYDYGVYGYGYSGVGVSGKTDSYSGVGVQGYGPPGGSDFDAIGPGTNYAATSSIRWKDNITEINPQVALDKILHINGSYFNWKIYNESHDMGFIAEQIGEYVPEVVNYETDLTNSSNWYIDEKGNKKLYATGLDYGALTPMLVEAIKGQQQIINQLNKTIDNLQLDNKKMKQSLCKLGAKEWC
ncbi:Uncharacterised protein [uncultured archaeon]|nr:Uncharacterised protein [uncultured archaeon]